MQKNIYEIVEELLLKDDGGGTIYQKIINF